MNLFIVESPAKAKTINKYLGSNFTVVASYGHVRDLPSKSGAVDPDNDFAMIWESDARAAKQIKAIADLAKDAEKIVLATDPDREGEAIAWHLHEILKNRRALGKKPVERVVFSEITKTAVQNALAKPRALNQPLIDAYLTRRALDYLVGFTLSPVLWRKLPGSKSAGRVQSVALRLICDREDEIDLFIPQDYWTIHATFVGQAKIPFAARLKVYGGEKLEKFTIKTTAEAASWVTDLKTRRYAVTDVRKKQVSRHPAAPFITSTLQQEAARKLGFSPAHTMRVAQKLYEGVAVGGETVGLITYMRTDGTQLSGEAIGQARSYIEKHLGEAYLPKSARAYTSKAKNAQEAHEAIRPTAVSRTPESLRGKLSSEEHALYALIWQRMVACQTASAVFDQVQVDITSDHGKHIFGANGQTLVFDGFLRLYQEGRDEAGDDEDNAKLPPLTTGEAAHPQDIHDEAHTTEPPPRYSEASLVKKMEELGIGRPSTYASILQVLRDREYVRLESKRLIPEDRGRLVISFLKHHFAKYVDKDFTAGLEDQLDTISSGDLAWKQVIQDFWKDFKGQTDQALSLKISDIIDELSGDLAHMLFPKDEAGQINRACPSCETGILSLKLGKTNAFIGCNRYPECRYTRAAFGGVGEGDEAGGDGERILGEDPTTGLSVRIKRGPYGPYIQLGEDDPQNKPKRTPLPTKATPESLTLEAALSALRLPRDVGVYPPTGEMIQANVGRFGPYLRQGKQFVSIPKALDLYTITLPEALDLIEKATEKAAANTRELGPHPKDKKPIVAKRSRFGIRLYHGKRYVTAPKGTDFDGLTLDNALGMLGK
jgi:DNA topoisomerase-1